MPKAETEFDYCSATVPNGALFVVANDPLLIYPSVAAAERRLEAIIVANGVYLGGDGPNLATARPGWRAFREAHFADDISYFPSSGGRRSPSNF